MEGTLPSEQDPRGTFTPVNLASELKVQVGQEVSSATVASLCVGRDRSSPHLACC